MLDYIELVYACSMLGVIAIPLNTRLSTKEIDRVLEDARPNGIVRHSSLAVPGVQLSWQQVIDEPPLPIRSDPTPKIFYDPEAVLGLIYTDLVQAAVVSDVLQKAQQQTQYHTSKA